MLSQCARHQSMVAGRNVLNHIIVTSENRWQCWAVSQEVGSSNLHWVERCFGISAPVVPFSQTPLQRSTLAVCTLSVGRPDSEGEDSPSHPFMLNLGRYEAPRCFVLMADFLHPGSKLKPTRSYRSVWTGEMLHHHHCLCEWMPHP